MRGQKTSGIISAHQLKASIELCIRDLELIANPAEPEDFSLNFNVSRKLTEVHLRPLGLGNGLYRAGI